MDVRSLRSSRRQPIERALGIRFGGEELYVWAFTHRSFAYENGGLPTNERLEFLGDAVLGLVVTDIIYRAFPDLPEGQLAKLRAATVNMNVLAEVARELGIGEAVRLGRGEELSGGRDKSSILADTLEAVLGAIYLDKGLSRAAALGWGQPSQVRVVMGSAPDGEGVVTAEIDLDYLARVRSELPSLTHARLDR